MALLKSYFCHMIKPWTLPVKFLVLVLISGITVQSGAQPSGASYYDSVEEVPEYSKVGPLNAIVIENIKDAPYIVYLHGYGGTGSDAYEELQTEINKNKTLKQFNWIFPDNPRGGWFDMAAVLDGEGTPNVKRWQATLVPTRQLLKKMIESAKIDPRKVIWAGFSQGAVTAVDYVLHSQVPPLGLIVNSGIFFDSTDWKRENKNLVGVPFFMSHDKNDQILPFEEAIKLEKLLLQKGMTGQMRTHLKDHTVPQGFLPRVLKRVLDNQLNTEIKNCNVVI
jgi:predicted esterase